MAKEKCNPVMWIIMLILITVGLWCLVHAFALQFTGTTEIMASLQATAPWYFVGVLLIGIGKMLKCKCGACCCK